MPNIVYNTTATAAPSSSVAFTDAGEIFTAGNITSGNTAIAPTVVAGTVNAATIGNTGATLTGTVSTAAQPNITSVGTLTGLSVTGNILPSANVTYNLGSSTARWKDLYLSGTTIDLGGTTISAPAGGGLSIATINATNVNAATIGNSGATLTGTVSTASQPNITTLAGVTSIGAAGVITAVVGNLTVGGNFTVTGNSVSIGASTLSIVDPVISLNTPSDLSPLTTTTTADIGLKFHYYSGSDRHAFLGRAQDTGYLEWYSDGNDTANVFTGTAYGGIKAGALFLANTGTVLTTSGTIVAATVNAATIGNSGAVLYGTLNSASASQPNITTLAGVTSIGASGVTTSVVGNLSITGSGGNVTGVNTLFATTINSATLGNIGANHVGTGTYLTSLNASNLSSGTVPSAQISGSYTGITGVGTIATGTWQGSAIGASYVSTLNQNTTGSAATFTSTSQNSQFNSVGVGTAGSGTGGEIRATNNITAYYSSDAQFKENVQDVPDALSIVTAIGSKLFDWTDAYIADHGGEDGYFVQKSDFGVIAQDVQRVFPQAVRTRPDGSLAVDYEKLGTLAFGAIEQLLARVEALEARIQ